MSIAEHLVRAAVPAGTGATWEGDDMLGDREDDLTLIRGPVGPDLYGGAAGIAWFLGHIAAYTSSDASANAALAGLHFALSQTAEHLDPRGPSLYAGATGVALAAVEVGDCLNHDGLRQSGLVLASRVAQMIGQQPPMAELDLIAGRAGVIIGLLAIHRHHADERLLDACRSACEPLMSGRREELVGCAWPEPNGAADAPALCGLGHGAAGIAWSLMELAWATDDHALLAVAHDALRYERSWFSAARCAWPDLRQPPADAAGDESWPGWTTAWCHGALGIGAVRLRLYEVERDMNALAEATSAIQAARRLVVESGTSLRQGVVSDPTLCHGLGGAIELVLLAYEILALDDHLRAGRRIGDLCLDMFRTNHGRWSCGLRNAEQVPGLFLGLAGIGVTMLRLHDPTSIGSPMLAGRLPGRTAGDA